MDWGCLQGAKIVSVLQLKSSCLYNPGVLNCHLQEHLNQEFVMQNQGKLSNHTAASANVECFALQG